MGIWGFLRRYPGPAVGAVLGGVCTISSFVNEAYSLINLGLPGPVWSAIGAGVFFLSVIAIQYRSYQEQEKKFVPLSGLPAPNTKDLSTFLRLEKTWFARHPEAVYKS